MPILALDTATLVSSVALADDKKLLAELTLQTKLTHSEVLMPHIKQVMDMAKAGKGDICAVAVSIGPGSFTGLRIGLAAAKSMAYALRIPIVGVPTLKALAYHYPMSGFYIAPVLDAQKSNAYTALYEWIDGQIKEIQPPAVEHIDEILIKAQALEKRVIFVGETAVKHREKIALAGGNIISAMIHTVMPRAACVAVLGQKMLEEGKADDVMALEPLYIRRSEAEVLWEMRKEKKNG